LSPATRTERPHGAPPADPSAASAALRRSTVASTVAREPRSADVDGADWWPPDGPLSGTAESRERLAYTGERAGSVAQDAAEAAFARGVTACTRLLRDGGMRPRHVVAAVADVVRAAAAPSLAGGRLDVAIHDARRQCVGPYFAR
jgi:hypothetical protein